MDIVIPIVFPDYKIAVDIPDSTVTVPDLGLNIMPSKIRLPGMKSKWGHLGHAGVLFIHGKTGLTKYYEYGRYDRAALGETHQRHISDVKIGPSGVPTAKSLIAVLNRLSSVAGQRGRISGAFIQVPDGKFKDMQAYATKREADNHNPKRAPYELTANSCMHFSKSVAEAGGATIPWIFDPRPNSFIDEVQDAYPPLEFRPPDKLTVTGVSGF